MGTSGAPPSAEREPDSLEREDDSLFPCLLELFLSHISPAKSSPPFFLSSPPPAQSLTHDPFAPLGGDGVGTSEQRNWPTVTCRGGLVDDGAATACTSSLQSSLKPSWRRSSSCADQSGPYFGFYQYLFCAKYSAVPSHVKHWRARAHRRT